MLYVGWRFISVFIFVGLVSSICRADVSDEYVYKVYESARIFSEPQSNQKIQVMLPESSDRDFYIVVYNGEGSSLEVEDCNRFFKKNKRILVLDYFQLMLHMLKYQRRVVSLKW